MSFAKISEFRRVQLTNQIVHRIQREGGTLEDCVVALSKDRDRLIDRVIELESIAPKKVQTPHGVMVWHCPDELVPLSPP